MFICGPLGIKSALVLLILGLTYCVLLLALLESLAPLVDLCLIVDDLLFRRLKSGFGVRSFLSELADARIMLTLSFDKV